MSFRNRLTINRRGFYRRPWPLARTANAVLWGCPPVEAVQSTRSYGSWMRREGMSYRRARRGTP